MKMIVASLLATLLVLCSLTVSASEIGLTAIVPDHVGWTVQKSPVLYFFISQATSLPIRFSLLDKRRIAPVADVPLSSPTGPGFVAIRLKDYNIVLEEDVQYRWYVSVVLNPDSRSKDIVAGGMIEHVGWVTVGYLYDGPSCDQDVVRFLMKAGVWYDGFACLNKLIETNPEDRTLRDLRQKLLGRQKNYLYFP